MTIFEDLEIGKYYGLTADWGFFCLDNLYTFQNSAGIRSLPEKYFLPKLLLNFGQPKSTRLSYAFNIEADKKHDYVFCWFLCTNSKIWSPMFRIPKNSPRFFLKLETEKDYDNYYNVYVPIGYKKM